LSPQQLVSTRDFLARENIEIFGIGKAEKGKKSEFLANRHAKKTPQIRVQKEE